METSSKPRNALSVIDVSIRKSMRVSQREYLFLRNQALWASRRGNPELALKLFSSAANFASLFHPGFFFDSVAENEILRIGQEVSTANDDKRYLQPPIDATIGFSILHVVSAVSKVGGLCRTIIHWIHNDINTRHTVVVLRQSDAQAFDWFRDELEGSGTSIISLDPDSTMLHRSIELRNLASSGFSGCINHVAQAESIPIVAFASTADLPPVAWIDHADHSFWLGLSVADIVIHQRPVGATLCQDRRCAKSCFVLPIPLQVHSPKLSREEVRKKLGLEPDSVMGLTVGRRDKYRPTSDQNFFKSAKELVEQHPNLILYVVGVEKARAESWARCSLPDAQMVFMGETPVDPALWEAADIYLESYPFGSQTAFLEAALAGIAPVRAPVGGTPLLATSDSAIDGLLQAPVDEREFIQQASWLISNPTHRKQLAKQLQENVVLTHTGDVWRRKLEAFYKILRETKHCPGKVPLDTHADDIHDTALHRWHRMHEDGLVRDHTLRLTAKWLVNNVMSREIRCSNYRLLPSLATRSLCCGRGDRTILQMGIQSMFRLLRR